MQHVYLNLAGPSALVIEATQLSPLHGAWMDPKEGLFTPARHRSLNNLPKSSV